MNTRKSKALSVLTKAYLVLVLTVCTVILGCRAREKNLKPELTQDKNGNLTLAVSNQSSAINPVDIRILLDGTRQEFQGFRWTICFQGFLPPGGKTLCRFFPGGDPAGGHECECD